VIQVDVRGEQIGRRVPVEAPLVGTVKDTVDALLPLLDAQADSAHLDRMTAHYRRARSRLDKLARDRANDSPLHPQYVAATDRPAGRRRRGLHRRRRHPVHLGGPLPADERNGAG
jgi:pyruvate dehydrogenase (quinone)